MSLSLIIGGVATILTTLGLLLRRRISRNWITQSAITSAIAAGQKQPTNGQNQQNQTIVITGGNTGLGFSSAMSLASCGFRIIIACRNETSGDEAAALIRFRTGNQAVKSLQLDLASLESVQSFANQIITKEGVALHCLICNAGVWVPDSETPQRTKDGFEIHFGINHLGHFALIKYLLPSMKKLGINSRIVIVSSSLAKFGNIDLEKKDFIYESRKLGQKQKSFAPPAYCDSKLMNMLTCRELASRLEDTSIATYAVSPGFCRSQLGRHSMSPFKRMLAFPIMRLLQRTSEQGALNILFPTVADKATLESGVMYQDGKPWEEGLDLVKTLGNDVQKDLWQLSEDLIKGKGF